MAGIFLVSSGCSLVVPNNRKNSGQKSSLTGLNSTPSEKDPASGAYRFPLKNTQFGVALVSMRYNPFGPLSAETLPEGASDMRHLGFKTLKIWADAEVMYRAFSGYKPSDIAQVRTITDLLKLKEYQATLALNFEAFFIHADAPTGEGNVWDLNLNQPLTAKMKDNIYKNIFDATTYLLKTYANSGKIFVLQNHEGDWHIMKTPSSSTLIEKQQMENMRTYLTLRQEAVNAARRESVEKGVFVYHACEVVRVYPSAVSKVNSIASDILPDLSCDLVGYSAYETTLESKEKFELTWNYLKKQTKPSFAFGDNNVAITEIGLPERKSPSQLKPVLDSIQWSVAKNLPFILYWTGYDNGCTPSAPNMFKSADAEICEGFWIRKPDRKLGIFYKEMAHFLEDGTHEDFIVRSYQKHLGREPAPSEIASSLTLIRDQGRPALEEGIGSSPEAVNYFALRLYQRFSGRVPDPAGLEYWKNVLMMEKNWGRVSEDFISSLALTPSVATTKKESSPNTGMQTPNAIFNVVGSWFSGYLGRMADRDGQAYWVNQITAGGACKATALSFLEAVHFGAESQMSLTDDDFVKRLYLGFLGRASDPAGYAFWMQKLSEGVDRRQVALSFFDKSEFQLRCP